MALGGNKLEQLIWEEARQQVQAVNPELAQIIDDIAPDSHLPLFKATYSYGSHIIKRGILHLPNASGQLVPWSNSAISRFVQNSLRYHLGTSPVSLLLNKTVEIFFIFDGQAIPLSGLILPGTVFNACQLLNTTDTQVSALWDITAGARSILMLPPIAERAAHDKLCKKLNINIPKPEALLSQWQIFKTIINSTYCSSNWTTELLFFGSQWFEYLSDNQFIYLKNYLYLKAWESTDHFRHQFIWDLVFSLIRQQRHIKFDSYITDTVEHLLMIGVGAMPGFVPATDDMAAPVTTLQTIYRNIYGLKKYEPVMLHLQHFDMNQPNQSVYYSLGYPTTVRFSPRTTKITTKLNDIICIKLAMQKCLEELGNDKYNIQHTPLSRLPQQFQYNYFHNADNHHGIQPCEAILKKDSLFKTLVGEESVPKNSPFL